MKEKKLILTPVVIFFITLVGFIITKMLKTNQTIFYLFFALPAVLGFFFGGIPCAVCSICALIKTSKSENSSKNLFICLEIIEIIGSFFWLYFAGREFYYGLSI